MKRTSTVILALLFGAALFLGAAGPVGADMGQRAANTGINMIAGWVDCPKAYVDEVQQESWWRTILGVFITGPVMCATNVGARYLGVAADIPTMPILEDNVVKPAVHESQTPPIRLPKS